MNTEQPILVIGGTRGTGLLIARILHRQGRRVRVVARDRTRALTLFDPAIQVLDGDITKPQTLEPVIQGARHIIFTAGCRSGYPVREPQVRLVEYEGMRNTLAAARQLGFAGRFLYMNSSGLMSPSLFATCLNLWKGNTLIWRRRAEEKIRKGGLDYTIIRTGVLLNQPGGQHLINVTQQSLPLSFRYRIARADAAALFVAALDHPKTVRATFEAVWGERGQRPALSGIFDRLKPDRSAASSVATVPCGSTA